MSKRFTFLCIICLFTAKFCIQAQDVSLNTAREKAARFIATQKQEKIQKNALQCAYTETVDNKPLFYIFNASNAYVMVAADETLPILAYSTTQTFDNENIVPAQKMWMDNYRRQLTFALNEVKANQDKQVHEVTRISEGVEPLLESRWNQGRPYNYFCPKDEKGQNERCVTGCVATAMAQLMYYFRWPESGVGSYSYTTKEYGTLRAHFDSAHYNYDNMCDNPTQINAAASLLCNHCGVSVDMVYGPSGSGMYNHKAAYAMRTYFKYSSETQYLFRDSNGRVHDSLHTIPYPLNWDSVIVEHLKKSIPLYYAGWNVPWTDGHGFVCDGYQKDSVGHYYFHFNFGWGGAADGYYYTENLYPGSSNFNLAQEIIVNAFPDTTKYTYTQNVKNQGESTLKHRTGSFQHPSVTNGNCLPNTDYTWHIRPEMNLDTIVELKIHIRCQLDSGDVLLITSNNKSFRSLFLSGKDTSFDFNSKIFPLDFHLTTTKNTNSRGIHCSYEAVYPEFCTTTRPSVKTSATLEDGSGKYHYNNNACCRSIINIKGYNGVYLHFHYLETEKSVDLLRFYDYKHDDSLLLELSGQLGNDSIFYLPSNVITVEFTTNDSVTDQGWSFTYTASKTAIAETMQSKVCIYPNPTQEQINIVRKDGNVLGELRIFDLSGRLLMYRKVTENTYNCKLSEYAKGMYFIQITDENGTHVHKFNKE